MKRTVFSFFLLMSFVSAVAQQRTIVVTNSLPVVRTDLVEIPWSLLLNAYPSLDTSNFKVINSVTKKELPFQLEYKAEENIQQLLVRAVIPAKGNISLQLVKGNPKPIVSKTFARYVPERKDDFAWENDRIAHRMYGKALQKTPKEMAYGVDVWVKRTDSLVINKRYKLGKYHVDYGDGLDYYHVGLTLGAGGIAPYINDTIWYAGTYSEWEILDNGPLRTSFRLRYDEWTAAGRKIKMTNTISIDAGSQLSKNELKFETDGSLPVVAGIIKRKEAGEMLLNEKDGLLAYWEPKHGADGTTGVAVLFSTPVTQMMVKQGQLLAESIVLNNEPFIYYNGAVWDKAGIIQSAKDWFDYLQQFQRQLNNKLKITIR